MISYTSNVMKLIYTYVNMLRHKFAVTLSFTPCGDHQTAVESAHAHSAFIVVSGYLCFENKRASFRRFSESISVRVCVQVNESLNFPTDAARSF